jgi:hypothetical protein
MLLLEPFYEKAERKVAEVANDRGRSGSGMAESDRIRKLPRDVPSAVDRT